MYKDRKIASVVPAYNEGELVLKVIKTMPDFVDHIIIVDDASRDNTYELAKSTTDPRVVVIKLEKNLGVGGAIMAGHRRMLELGDDISVVMAGDAQMDPAYLPQLLDPLIEEDYDFSKGNRFLARDSLKGMPAYRVFGNVILTFMTKFASGYWHIFDPQNGYTAITRGALELLDFDHIHNRYPFENDLLINLNIFNIRVKDVSIPAVYGEEQSHIRLHKVIPSLLVALTTGYFRRITQKYVLRSFSPVALFLLAGGVLFLWGAGFGLYELIKHWGREPAATGIVMLAVLPFLVGFELLLQAVVLDINESPR
jgi:glycosyltransferase involved in cell wall biosynthesis